MIQRRTRSCYEEYNERKKNTLNCWFVLCGKCTASRPPIHSHTHTPVGGSQLWVTVSQFSIFYAMLIYLHDRRIGILHLIKSNLRNSNPGNRSIPEFYLRWGEGQGNYSSSATVISTKTVYPLLIQPTIMGTIIRWLCHRSHGERRQPAKKKKKKHRQRGSPRVKS